MINKTLTVKKELKDHQVADIVCAASTYRSTVQIHTDNKHFNAKSLMGMFALQLEQGMQLDLEVNGDDEADAFVGMKEALGA